MSRQRLLELIAEGLSTREIAGRLGRSPTTVRYWLARYGLATHQAARRKSVASACSGSGDVDVVCRRHGMTRHRVRADSGVACLRCRAESVTRRRRRMKQQLVREAGGCCRMCGYSRSPAALVFHHLDPASKRFGLAHGGRTRSLARAREEVRECLLLCANCHAELEAGAAVLPRSLVQVDPG